ncbi:GGDEF domain-containing protein [Williamsia herbipolensis]|uniref:GGDEF domain-containing protein n=1 Tax=Williamsia herbipolensis TaxID=1603258 RepID=A0AAU4JX31_9NOCA|nr:GGDEF domain-containing protein [Williamsia herbipolensis]
MPTPDHTPDRPAPVNTIGAGGRSHLVRWLTGPHDYAWIVDHHSMRSLRSSIRAVFAGNTLLMAVCSALLLRSPDGPQGTVARTVALVVMAVQAAAIVLIVLAPMPTTQRRARNYFVGFGVFGDVGLTLILVLYSPVVHAIGCALFVINSALCTYFVSSRWLLAHLAWAAAVIGYALWRVDDAHLFDPYAVAAGGLVLLAAVCGVPIAAHIAWNRLSIDAQQSLVDPLTGLRNRRGIEVSVEPLWERASRDGLAIAAVVVDIDDFKRVNDTHGHVAGDDVLRSLARRMRDTLGRDAVAGRTGGEEFTVVLCGTRTEVTGFVDRLPRRLSDTDDAVPVTVSVGATVIGAPRDHHFPESLDAAMRDADTRMYAAKRAGGGQSSTALI